MNCVTKNGKKKRVHKIVRRKTLNWKKKQQQKLEKNTEVTDARMILKKKPPKKSKNKGRRIMTQKSTTHKAKKKPVKTLCNSKTEEFRMFCLGSINKLVQQ